MSPINTISPRTISLNSERPRGYSGADDVRNRAAVTKGGDTVPQRLALNRLERVLTHDQLPKADVPRGYYLDITV